MCAVHAGVHFHGRIPVWLCLHECCIKFKTFFYRFYNFYFAIMSEALALEQAPKEQKYSRLSQEQYSVYLEKGLGFKDPSVLLNGNYFQIVEKTGNNVKVMCIQCINKTTLLSAGLDSTNNLLRHLRVSAIYSSILYLVTKH